MPEETTLRTIGSGLSGSAKAGRREERKKDAIFHRQITGTRYASTVTTDPRDGLRGRGAIQRPRQEARVEGAQFLVEKGKNVPEDRRSRA